MSEHQDFILIYGSALSSPESANDVDVLHGYGASDDDARRLASAWASKRGLGHLPLDIHRGGYGDNQTVMSYVPGVSPEFEQIAGRPAKGIKFVEEFSLLSALRASGTPGAADAMEILERANSSKRLMADGVFTGFQVSGPDWQLSSYSHYSVRGLWIACRKADPQFLSDIGDLGQLLLAVRRQPEEWLARAAMSPMGIRTRRGSTGEHGRIEWQTSSPIGQGSKWTGNTQYGLKGVTPAEVAEELDLEPETIVVTRHAGLVQHLINIGLSTEGTPVVDHATADLVRGKHVIGVLPLWLAAEAASVTEIPMQLPPELRGEELTVEQTAEYSSSPKTYTVEVI